MTSSMTQVERGWVSRGGRGWLTACLQRRCRVLQCLRSMLISLLLTVCAVLVLLAARLVDFPSTLHPVHLLNATPPWWFRSFPVNASRLPGGQPGVPPLRGHSPQSAGGGRFPVPGGIRTRLARPSEKGAGGNSMALSKEWHKVGLVNMSWTEKPVGAGGGQTEAVGHRHVFFLKVHKAASTTVMNILYRFSLRYKLYVMLPRQPNILSESSKLWRHAAIDPPLGVKYFDILCNHLVFNEDIIRESLPPDTKFIGIVRDPLAQSVSAFLYYSTRFHLPYLMNVSGPDRLRTYMQSPERWEPKRVEHSFTHNRMSLDFGMDAPGLAGDQRYITQYIAYLNRTFHLVMVSERFDESMVLMKRLLGWQLRDVLYIKSNVLKSRSPVNPLAGAPPDPARRTFTEQEKQKHRAFNAADYALYEHFSDLFQKRVEAEGPSFADEVSTYRSLLSQLNRFCGSRSANMMETVAFNATKWSDRFLFYRAECVLMTMEEIPLIQLKRMEQKLYGSKRTNSPFAPQPHSNPLAASARRLQYGRGKVKVIG